MSSSAEFSEAVAAGDTDRVRAFLTADPALATARNETGATALHYAAANGQRGIVALLRDVTRLPALTRATDAQGKPLRVHARESGHEEIARLFEREQS